MGRVVDEYSILILSPSSLHFRKKVEEFEKTIRF